ncbi:gliding motility-associated-like protein [Oceanihabitans sediminis]|uniref:Ig-like domain-containing protein n=1 Tax=Oceanihabitans sediminis TaxID=1812012 RepID=A0A368P1W4_9FLAO|nr:choice-of-anchor L domain-containing protein [Oceanihabitans sediminis]RBP30878.1 gliding motility-associated-like protein [Oceanihabitans sediminis]RCU56842.1 hypothetical protein DU428_10845 [Oceanihabitans sediminis]
MKNFLLIICSLSSYLLFSQNIQVDNTTHSAQELIENILINSDCISNVTVTNVVGGNFGDADTSFGYFDASGTTFPIASGLVLSTGRLSNVPGPNNTLSDDTASGWGGDSDLETVLNETDTHNATIIEFEFEAISEQISFRYLFASEEYQEGNTATCRYSDLFGFLIRPADASNYTNIALVPSTQTPVKVTTIHSGIPGSCPPINEEYFGSWNGSNAPINFNGQTTVLTASAEIRPHTTYHVKLVIADHDNYRYDSAVFLEAGSFTSNMDLGVDRLLANNNPLCENETLELYAVQQGATGYNWFKDGVQIIGENNPTYTIEEAGTYSVEITYPSACFTSGEITVEYTTNPLVNDTSLIQCDLDQNGITTYNLFDAAQSLTTNTQDIVTSFHHSTTHAEENTDAITNPTSFENTTPLQKVYARVENQYGCHSVAELTLDISNNTVNIPPFEICDNFPVDGFSDFNLNDLRTEIETQVPSGSNIEFYLSEEDALEEINSINGNFTNTVQDSQTIFVLITNSSGCYAISTVLLKTLETPNLEADEQLIYCTSTYPETIQLNAGITNDSPGNYNYEWVLDGAPIGFNTSNININETGTYTVTATHNNSGCSATRNISVSPIDAAVIESVSVNGLAPNNSVTITVSGNGEYEFALDNLNGNYQNNNIFYNVEAGEHIIYVREKKGCGITPKTINVLGFPSFFTPNGDNFNDTWMPVGVDLEFKATMTIHVFDRYGKLLKQLSPTSKGFDGTYKEKKLPASDYWYIVTFSDGQTYKGHFSLKR